MPWRSHQPGHDVEPGRGVELDGVAVKQAWRNDPVAICCELVGDELGVDGAVADHVGEKEDPFLRGAVRGVGDVGFRWEGVDLRTTVVLSEGDGGRGTYCFRSQG